MSRLWWATIAGLVLGAVLFGMMQRGCDATGDTTRRGDHGAAGGVDDPTGAARRFSASTPIADPLDATRQTVGKRLVASARASEAARAQYEAPAPIGSRNTAPSGGGPTTAVTTDSLTDRMADNAGRRRAPMSPERRRRDGLGFERLPNVAAPTGAAGNGAAGAAPTPASAGLDATEVATAGGQDQAPRVTQGEVADAAARFRQSLADPRGENAAATGDRKGENALGDKASADGDQSRSGGGSGGQFQTAGRGTGGLGGGNTGGGNSGGGNTGGGNTGGGNTGGGNTGGGNTGGGSTGGGSSGGGNTGGGNTGGGNTGGGGTGGGSGGTTTPPPPEPVIARWISAPAVTCPDVANFRTNDLYLGFTNPALVLVMSSDARFGLAVTGGRFFQDTTAFGSNAPPDPALLQVSPCVGADSYLTLGGQTPTFAPGSEPNREDWGGTLSAIWFTLTGAVARQDVARFGDDRWYVQIARVTTGGADIAVQGALLANYVDLSTGQNNAALVPVLNCASCWQGASGEVTPARLASLTLLTSTVAGGATARGVVTLASPAPPGGTVVSLTTNRPAVATAPTTVLVRQGESTAAFDITTQSVGAPVQVIITASAAGATSSAMLEVDPVAVASLTFGPATVTSGRPTTVTVTLNGPAPAGNVVVTFVTATPGIVDMPPKITIYAGQTTRSFQVKARPVVTPTKVNFLAYAFNDGALGAFGSVTVEPSGGDLNGDGVVDANDLALLLGSWGPCPPGSLCAADLTGDGVVNAADQALLLGAWTTGTSGGGGGGPDAAVVARWVANDTSGASCPDVAASRSADLYVGFLTQDRVVLLNSDDANGIRISGGAFYQAQFGGNSPPNPGLEAIFPCLKFDSYVAFDGVQTPDSITFAEQPDVADWGTTLRASWFAFVNGHPGVDPKQNQSRFGDNRYYLRVGRFTAPATAVVSGQITVFHNPAGASIPSTTVVSVPDWTQTRAAYDLNHDGAVNAQDVGRMSALMGSSGPAGDLNGDGVVNAQDLRMLMDAVVAEQAEARR